MMSLHSELRAQLGVAVPAMALPEDTSEDPEPVLLFFGIVDFLQVATPSFGHPFAQMATFAPYPSVTYVKP